MATAPFALQQIWHLSIYLRGRLPLLILKSILKSNFNFEIKFKLQFKTLKHNFTSESRIWCPSEGTYTCRGIEPSASLREKICPSLINIYIYIKHPVLLRELPFIQWEKVCIKFMWRVCFSFPSIFDFGCWQIKGLSPRTRSTSMWSLLEERTVCASILSECHCRKQWQTHWFNRYCVLSSLLSAYGPRSFAAWQVHRQVHDNGTQHLTCLVSSSSLGLCYLHPDSASTLWAPVPLRCGRRCRCVPRRRPPRRFGRVYYNITMLI